MPHLTALMLEILLLGECDCINSRSSCRLRHTATWHVSPSLHWTRHLGAGPMSGNILCHYLNRKMSFP